MRPDPGPVGPRRARLDHHDLMDAAGDERGDDERTDRARAADQRALAWRIRLIVMACSATASSSAAAARIEPVGDSSQLVLGRARGHGSWHALVVVLAGARRCSHSDGRPARHIRHRNEAPVPDDEACVPSQPRRCRSFDDAAAVLVAEIIDAGPARRRLAKVRSITECCVRLTRSGVVRSAVGPIDTRPPNQHGPGVQRRHRGQTSEIRDDVADGVAHDKGPVGSVSPSAT